MGLFNFSKREQPKQFTYLPIHFDEDEERRKKLYGRRYDDSSTDASKLRIQESFKRGSYYFEKPNVTKQRRKSNILTLVITFILITAVLYILMDNLEAILALGL